MGASPRPITRMLERLAARGDVEVDALSAELGMSDATIRRDLDQLAHQPLLTRIQGAAVVHSWPTTCRRATRPRDGRRRSCASGRPPQR